MTSPMLANSTQGATITSASTGGDPGRISAHAKEFTHNLQIAQKESDMLLNHQVQSRESVHAGHQGSRH